MLESLILGVTLLTPHVDHGFQYKTPGVYAVIDDSLVVGTVRNSLHRQSVYVAGKIDGPFGSDLVVGAITGYPQAPVCPLVAIGKTVGPVRAQFIPPTGRNAAALVLSVEWRLK